jgi:hypothetical protein|tara:strand:- start:26 stop:571 length:546 start_codon:yes stop_codon:yes gene_type:complete
MIEIPFTDEMVKNSYHLAQELGSIKNSITQGGGNRAGYLGELAVSEYINAEHVSCDWGEDKYNRDLLLKGKNFEVKTKRRCFDPKSDYDASVADTSTHQKTDYYIHLSITFGRHENRKVYYDPLRIWLCGIISKEQYFIKSKVWNANEVDSSNDFKTHVKMHNLSYKELIDPKGFFKEFNK